MHRILLVEPDELNGDMLVRRLRRRGFEAVLAHSAEQADESLKSDGYPDLVLLDLHLSGEDSLVWARSLREDGRAPVIAISARALPADRSQALAAGCADFEAKPYDFEKLLTKIRSCISKHNSRKWVLPIRKTVQTSSAPRVLVVDDELSNRDLLSRRLERRGYRTVSASGGAEALLLIQNQDFDLILLDQMMPEMSGLDVLRRVRRNHSAAELPVIMVTAVSDSASVVQALETGANDYITKPLDFGITLARIAVQLHRKQAEQNLRKNEERLTLALRGSSDGLWDWDIATGIVYYSPRWKSMLEYEEAEIEGTLEAWLSLVHPDDAERVREDLHRHVEGGLHEFNCDYRIRRKSGSYLWVRGRANSVRDARGHATRVAGAQSDVHEQKVLDPLTNLPNRLLFRERLMQAVERAGQDRGYVFGVLFVDLDRFKLVNDSHGHAVGDKLLVGVARRLKSAIRSGEVMVYPDDERSPDHMLARLGGDEFALLLDDIRDPSNAAHIADRIRREVSRPYQIDGLERFVSVSIGVTVSGGEYLGADEMLRDSDTALSRAKARGKDRVEVFDTKMRAETLERLELESDLRLALEQKQFTLRYQPKVELATGQILGFEALVRWNHPSQGLMLPGRFIPLAEETGLIVELGNEVLEQGVKQLKEWHSSFPREPELCLSVNVSVKQLLIGDFPETIRRVLDKHGISPSLLNLEVTESVMMEDASLIEDTLNQIREIGVGLEIDDFGTGYSSLSYLHRLPFHTLKVDRSFVRNLCDHKESAEIVRAIIALAQGLRMNVIAEGIETAAQAKYLIELGCVQGQGNYFAVPLDRAVAEERLRQGILPPIH